MYKTINYDKPERARNIAEVNPILHDKVYRICDIIGLNHNGLFGKSQEQKYTLIRYMLFDIFKNDLKFTTGEIANYFNRKHSIIFVSINKIRGFCKLYPEINQQYLTIKNFILN